MRRDREEPSRELTGPHKTLIDLLQRLGYTVVAEYPVGGYVVDCYLPEFHVGIEVDGPGHSRRRDLTRDSLLYNNCGLAIMRFRDILLSGKLDKLDYVAGKVQEFVGDFVGSVKERVAEAEYYERMYGA